MGKIYLYGVIGGEWYGDDACTSKAVRNDIAKFDAEEPIELRINSPGGDVMEAVSMIELLADHAGEVTCRIDGMAASAASFIAASCDKVSMASGGLYMIHNPWSVVQGGADDMRREADVLDKVRENLARQYAGRKACKLSLSEIEAAMAAETWYTAEEAKAAGLVDEVRGEGAKAMAIPKRLGFKNAPKDLYGKPARGGKVAALEASPALWASRIAQRRQATLRR